MNKILTSVWESKQTGNSKFKICESIGDSEVDGKYVLARVQGPTFFPNTTSRNKIFYSIDAWENAINDPDTVARLQAKLMFGTIGHDIELTDDEIRKEEFSHIVTKLWIQEGIGYAEYLILNTQPGRVLNTLLRVGSKISTSTRATGFLEESSKFNDVQSVDAEGFRLERIDFVLDPGYLEAKPQLLESLNLKGTKMSNNGTKTPVNILESHAQSLRDQLDTNNKELATLRENHHNTSIELASLKATTSVYEALGTPADIAEKLKKLAVYESIGDDPEEVGDTLEKSASVLSDLADRLEQVTGELDDLKSQLPEDCGDHDSYTGLLAAAQDNADVLAKYEEFGTPEEVAELVETANQAKDELEQYRSFGTPEELSELCNTVEAAIRQKESMEMEDTAKEMGVDTELLESLKAKGFSLNEAKTLVKQIREESEDEEDTDDPEDETNPSAEPDEDEVKSVQESLNRMAKSFSSSSKVRRSVKESKQKSAPTPERKSLAESLVLGNRNSRTRAV